MAQDYYRNQYSIDGNEPLMLLMRGISNIAGGNVNDEYLKALELARQGQAPQPLEGGFFRDPAAIMQFNKELQGVAQAQQAAPDLRKIEDFALDRRFQDRASMEEIAKNPQQAIFGQSAPNPNAQGSLAAFAKNNANTLDLTNANLAMMGQGMTPEQQAVALARTTANLEPTKVNANREQVDLTLKTGNASQEQVRTALFSQKAAEILNNAQLSWDDKMSGLATLTAQVPPSKEVGDKVMAAITALKPDLQTITTGTGNVDETQQNVINMRSKVLTPVGTVKRESPRGNKTLVNVNNQQESEYSKSTGRNLAEREGEILKQGDAADETLRLTAELRDVLKKSYSGPAAAVMPFANRVTSGALGNTETAANTTAAGTITGQMVLSKIKTLGANPSQRDLEFLQNMQAKTTYSRAEQKRMIDIMESTAQTAATKRNNLVGGTFNDQARANPARSEINVRATAKPKTAADYLKSKGY